MIKVYETVTLMKLDWLKFINAQSGWVNNNYLRYFWLVKQIYHSVTCSKKVKNSPENNVSNLLLQAT